METPNKGAGLSNANILKLIIEGKSHDWKEQYILGKQVRELGQAPAESETFLAIQKPWEDELIGDDDKVDLARPGIEQFYFRPVLLLTINGKIYKWYEQFITGLEVKQLAGISVEDHLWLAIKKPWEDEKIGNEEKVDLARPGIEHFYSKPEEPKEVVITINKVEYQVKPGIHTVANLKSTGGVPSAYELEQVIAGKLTPLKDDASVEIKGGEQFVSHVRDGSSS
ncbi:multiubiquitin domain-containing protein [Mucilaginibacter pocheonensis]|uniref:Multi-ubiquitin domain-containing protein n=1 Tax=Mucilaginibacter pocheonensis TaxID=398050 RepID=A0ABU1T7G9_9SPHI|nr:multiubiquitin domain-containing protein [Mucilaginibacter pocheonensis]MDR6941346.1 hypothetical protein [Mucilaginibacter pocheonensis]